MPSRAEQPARREVARRQAAEALRLAAAMAGYAAGQVADGLSPSEATRAALDAADAMEATAAKLRRLTGRLSPAECRALPTASRRALAVELVAGGLTQRQAARQLGVSPRRVWDYLRGR
jgi:DNA-binding NarL/FixJ family response regulator